jgi:PAS domain S-box-containing protein
MFLRSMKLNQITSQRDRLTSMNVDLFKAIVDEAPEAIIFADRDGAIRLWNRGAETIFGYAASEAIGRSLDLIIPDRLRAAHWAGFNRALETGVTRYAGRVLTTRSMHRSGSTLYVDLSFGLVKDADGTIAGAFAIGRECTARHAADKAQKARVAELEQQLGAAPSA